MPELSDMMFYRISKFLLARLAKVQAELEAGGDHTKAGQRLDLSPQLMGRVVHDLETAFPEFFQGLPLLKANSPPQDAMTEAGQLLLDFVTDVRQKSGDLIDELDRLRFGTDVNVAIIHSAWHAFGPDWQLEFNRKRPSGRIAYTHVDEINWAERICELVEKREADVGITSFPKTIPRTLVEVKLTPHPYMLVLSSDHPYSPPDGKTAVMRASHFADDAFVLYEPSRGYHRSSTVFEYLTRTCGISESRGVRTTRPRFITRSRFVECKESVAQGEGIAILPWAVVRRYQIEGGNQIKAYLLDPPMKELWKWSLVHRRNSSRAVVKDFVETVVSVDRANDAP